MNHDEIDALATRKFEPHITPVATYWKVFGILAILLVVTVLAAEIDLGYLNTPLAMLIAISKAAMIVLVFMNIRYAAPLVRIFAVAGFLWLILMFTFTFADLLTRH